MLVSRYPHPTQVSTPHPRTHTDPLADDRRSELRRSPSCRSPAGRAGAVTGWTRSVSSAVSPRETLSSPPPPHVPDPPSPLPRPLCLFSLPTSFDASIPFAGVAEPCKPPLSLAIPIPPLMRQVQSRSLTHAIRMQRTRQRLRLLYVILSLSASFSSKQTPPPPQSSSS